MGWASWKRVGKCQLGALSTAPLTQPTKHQNHSTRLWPDSRPRYPWGHGIIRGRYPRSRARSRDWPRAALCTGQYSHSEPLKPLTHAPWGKTPAWENCHGLSEVVNLGQTSDTIAVPSLGLLRPGVGLTHRPPLLCPRYRYPQTSISHVLPGLCKGCVLGLLPCWSPIHVAPTCQQACTCASLHSSPLVTKCPGGASAKGHPAPTHHLLTVQCPSRSWSRQRLQRGQRPGGYSDAERGAQWTR